MEIFQLPGFDEFKIFVKLFYYCFLELKYTSKWFYFHITMNYIYTERNVYIPIDLMIDYICTLYSVHCTDNLPLQILLSIEI